MMRRTPGASRFARASVLARRVGARREKAPNITARELVARLQLHGREEFQYG
jgi:hypothetical protein